jgi:ssDNA-binding replication factor A large subunit
MKAISILFLLLKRIVNELKTNLPSWTIKARVVNKTNLRTLKYGSGKAFNLVLSDKSDEISAIVLNENCDKFFCTFEKDKVYYISNAQLKESNGYSRKLNPFCITLNAGSLIQICLPEEIKDVPEIKYDFTSLKKLKEEKNSNKFYDIAALIINVGAKITGTSQKNKKDYVKRDILLSDDGETYIHLTLWNNDAENFDQIEGDVIFIKKCKISDLKADYIGINFESAFYINPKNKTYEILTELNGKIDQNKTKSGYYKSKFDPLKCL